MVINNLDVGSINPAFVKTFTKIMVEIVVVYAIGFHCPKDIKNEDMLLHSELFKHLKVKELLTKMQ